MTLETLRIIEACVWIVVGIGVLFNMIRAARADDDEACCEDYEEATQEAFEDGLDQGLERGQVIGYDDGFTAGCEHGNKSSYVESVLEKKCYDAHKLTLDFDGRDEEVSG